MSRKHTLDAMGITKVFLDGDSIEVAPGIDSKNWIKKDKADFLQKRK